MFYKKLSTFNSSFGFDKIISVTKVGIKEVYDVEIVNGDPNFIADNFVVHNCHAVAYGMITFVSMWLKTHYPLEFMCACIETENNEAE